jgi:hypothetical protein
MRRFHIARSSVKESAQSRSAFYESGRLSLGLTRGSAFNDFARSIATPELTTLPKLQKATCSSTKIYLEAE